jgi:bifunctional N-acetylglucosamine-1-phosphate-uridyltransferase/glucosamine-1-phosphate-acetyltransferase GlmU-like protein
MKWSALVSALDDGARFRSRVSLYMHPLAGRPMFWHALSAIAGVSPRPQRIVLVHRVDAALALPETLPVPVTAVVAEPGCEAEAEREAATKAAEGVKRVLLAQGATPLVTAGSLERALAVTSTSAVKLRGSEPEQGTIALVLAAREVAGGAGWETPAGMDVSARSRVEGIVVRDREALGEAATALRDRLVRQHQGNGVTFLLPGSVWLDCDVAIGADTVVYPGVVLEGRTEIGPECVIGPYCRLVEATIGRGVELKGWNYIARTSIRNHAVLEPHVRRGFE